MKRLRRRREERARGDVNGLKRGTHHIVANQGEKMETKRNPGRNNEAGKMKPEGEKGVQ